MLSCPTPPALQVIIKSIGTIILTALAYLLAGFTENSNIIIVDWGALSGNRAPASSLAQLTSLSTLDILPLYIDVIPKVGVVGKRIYEFITFMEATNQLQSGPESIHLIGQSLGAHVMGVAADYYKIATGTTIGRITGTEPGKYLHTSVKCLKPSHRKMWHEISVPFSNYTCRRSKIY